MIFVAGMILGIIITLIWAVTLAVLSSRSVEPDKKKIEYIIKEAEKIGSIKYRFNEADKIVKKQLEIVKEVYTPNKSAAHSKWKNDLIKQVNDLEKDKIILFKSIVKDGVDPVLKLIGPDGTPEKMKMSEAIKRAEDNDDTSPLKPKMPTKKTDSNNPKKNTSNLISLDAFKKGIKDESVNKGPKKTD